MSRNTLRIDVFQNFKLQIESCADKFVTRAAKVPEIAPKFLCTKFKTKKIDRNFITDANLCFAQTSETKCRGNKLNTKKKHFAFNI